MYFLSAQLSVKLVPLGDLGYNNTHSSMNFSDQYDVAFKITGCYVLNVFSSSCIETGSDYCLHFH